MFWRIPFHLAHFPFFSAQTEEEMNKIIYLFLFILLGFLFWVRWCLQPVMSSLRLPPRISETLEAAGRLTWPTQAFILPSGCLCLPSQVFWIPAIVFPAQLQEQGWEVHGGLKSRLLSLNPRMKSDFRNTFVFAFIFWPCLISFPFVSCTLISRPWAYEMTQYSLKR